MTNEEIKNAVDEIIESLDKKDYEHEAINWADLKVNEVQQKAIVTIDEASPDSYSLIQDIEDIFFNKYGIDIKVITEW